MRTKRHSTHTNEALYGDRVLGESEWAMMSQLKTDLEALCNLAKDLGATNAASLDAKSVVVDEGAQPKCSVL